MSDLLQVAMAVMVVAGYVTLWRMDASTRSAKRIHQAWRRNVAEYKRSISRLKQREADWGNLNQGRHELNTRYADAIKTREELNNRYSETINRMRAHHGIEDAMSDRITVYREVEHEAGREHVFWTVKDRESGYNQTFRSEEEAEAHADELKKRVALDG